MAWLNEARLGALYPAHLHTHSERATAALGQGSFDRLVIFAGTERLAFRDDAPYPFVANPYFKAWLPLVEHPGSALVFTPGQKPRLLYFKPQD